MEEEKGPKNEEGMRRRKEKLWSRKGGIHVLIRGATGKRWESGWERAIKSKTINA